MAEARTDSRSPEDRTPRDERATAIRILIVDRHDLYREGLARLLAGRGGLDVLAQGSGGKMAVRLAAELHPDVVLMEPRLVDLDGAAAAQTILGQDGSVRLVALSVRAEESEVTSALRAGFCGYLLKDLPVDDVAAAVRAAGRGTAWLAPRAAETLLNRLTAAHRDAEQLAHGIDGFSRPEIELLRRLARGQKQNEIAAELSISPETAGNYVSSILSKLGADRVPAAGSVAPGRTIRTAR